MAEQPRQPGQQQPSWSQAIEQLGTIARQNSTISNLAQTSHDNTSRLYGIVRQLLEVVQRLNTGRLSAEQVIDAARQAGEVQQRDVQRIQEALETGPSQEEIEDIMRRAADAITPTPPNQPNVGGAKKRRRRGGYKRSPTSGERRIVSGSTRRKRASRGKRSKRSPTKKRTRTRTGGRRR